MRRRHPLVRVRHILIRQRDRLRAKSFPVPAHGGDLDQLAVEPAQEEPALRDLNSSAFFSVDLVGDLGVPAQGATVGTVFLVEGWALHRSDPIEKIDVLVNGLWVQRARLGVPRPDVKVHFDQPDAIISGFECWVDLGAGPEPGSNLKLQLVAWAGDAKPAVLLDRCLTVAPTVEAGERSGRDGTLADRRHQLASSIAQPRSNELDLVVFTHQLGYGGAQLWLDELLRRSGAGSRYACRVISPQDGPLRDSLERRGIPVHVTNAPPFDDVDGYEGRVTELTALIVGGGHNVALVNTASALVGADVTTRLAMPTVWAIHESLTPRAFLTAAFPNGMAPEVRSATERAFARSDALVFEAEATRQLYESWAGPDRAIVVPYGVDTDAIDAFCRRVSREQARADTEIPSDARVVLVMGTMEPRKAQTRIAQAFALVRKHHPDWMLVFVGDSGTRYSEGLKEYLQDVGLEDCTRVEPVLSDIYPWYRVADLLLSLSDMESLPRSALEAMSFGVPVLSTSVFGLPELLQDGRTGFLFEPNDLRATTAALNRVLALDQSALASVGEAGRRHVFENYDSSGYVADFMALFAGLRSNREASLREILTRPGARASQGA